MSHHKTSKPTLTRRTLLAGTAAGITASGFTFGLTEMASGAISSRSFSGGVSADNRLCAAHHKELASHLKTILNASYVDDRMKNKILSTTTCPHCRISIAPDRMNHAAFAAL